MFEFITKLFGSRQERTISRLKKKVEEINATYARFQKLSHDQLRFETDKIRNFLKKELEEDEKKMHQLKKIAEENQDIKQKMKFFDEADALKKKIRQHQEKILDQHLVQAFAIVKSTAYRFSTQKELIVTATDHDKYLAEHNSNITIHGNNAHYSNTWEVTGHKKAWEMVHYDVQLMGGIIIHEGKIAEMGTGEGKTLVATLPVFLNALTGKGVHLMTVNEYLAKRDAEWMGPLYHFHGITLDCIENHPPYSLGRKKAYQADITYGTNSEFGFDYLRDKMAKTTQEQVQRNHEYLIADEIDLIALDQAGSSLVISGPIKQSKNKEYKQLNPKIQKLYTEQKKIVEQFLQEAKIKIAKGDKKEGGTSLFRVYRGLPKSPQFIHFLSEKGVKQILAETEDYYLQENKKFMPQADEPLFFTIDNDLNNISLTDKGIEYLTKQVKDPEFFILPNIANQLAEVKNNPDLTEQEIIKKKEQITHEYKLKSSRLHAINQLLKAYALFTKNVDYIVLEQKVKIVDDKTGRILEGRRYASGLHQAIEAKERVEIEKSSQTYASITSQNQLRMYHKLSGMTGTAATESAEFWEVYRLEVVTIPPNKPIRRKELNDRIYKTQHEKYNAIAQKVEELKKTGRPILIITPSVEVSEHLRKKLQVSPEQVLNAKNHHREADIIAKAGQLNSLTIATQMAGRGTDIKLSEDAQKVGGVYLIIVEKNEIRRVDRQNIGRVARNNQEGTTVCYLSLEDPLIVHFKHSQIGKYVDSLFEKEGEVLEHNRITKAIESVQKNREQNNFSSRKRTLEYDDVLAKQRNIIYKKRDHALHGSRLDLDIMYMIYDTVESFFLHNDQKKEEEVDFIDLEALSYQNYDHMTAPTPQKIKSIYQKILENRKNTQKKYLTKLNIDKAYQGPQRITHILLPVQCEKKIYRVHVELPEKQNQAEEDIIKAIEKTIVVNVIDQYWQEHLQSMEHLKESVRNATYENKDPLLVYKFEAIKYFKHLMRNINLTCTQYLCKMDFPANSGILIQSDKSSSITPDHSRFVASTHSESSSEESPTNPHIIPSNAPNIGRNERVTVQYLDGTVKKNVKYKTVQDDILEKKCVITTNK